MVLKSKKSAIALTILGCLSTGVVQAHENASLPLATSQQDENVCAGTIIVCAGGVNKDIFLDAISGNYKLVEKSNYLKKPIEWYKFNGNLQAYDSDDDTWSSLNHQDYSSLSRAGASMVDAGNRIYYIGGELKPSVRTPEIIGITFK